MNLVIVSGDCCSKVFLEIASRGGCFVGNRVVGFDPKGIVSLSFQERPLALRGFFLGELVMSNLEDAQKKLGLALSRLEEAAEKLVERGSGPDLSQELSELRKRCELLENRSMTVARRLDDSIDRIKQIIGSN